MKWLGIIRDVTIHREAFDRTFCIRSDQPLQATNFLNREEVLDAIRTVFVYRFDMFSMDGKRLLIRKRSYDSTELLDPQTIRHILQKLRVLA